MELVPEEDIDETKKEESGNELNNGIIKISDYIFLEKGRSRPILYLSIFKE